MFYSCRKSGNQRSCVISLQLDTQSFLEVTFSLFLITFILANRFLSVDSSKTSIFILDLLKSTKPNLDEAI